MIAVQKPPLPLFSAPTFRQSHSRHPSAPVVVRPTHTPGVLSLSKPLPQRLQQPPQPQRSPRVPKSKPQQRSPRPVPAQAASVEKPAPVNTQKVVGASPEEAKLQPALVIPNPDRSTRGRQQSKLAKDKADRRSISVSSSRLSARRLAHQPSPPPTRIPSQAEASTKLAVTPVLAHARVNHGSK
ncbi:hypothetical protein A0H81_12327 [Grifola frondosa]|uniref:Uncharacterized protein n=1 Tax=Grifola frondosa TaxID=5627 RepID=A0A1C7LSY6_GRIFR|nr:hypothetical protein A0H81_12327 [Grifola frondosa]